MNYIKSIKKGYTVEIIIEKDSTSDSESDNKYVIFNKHQIINTTRTFYTNQNDYKDSDDDNGFSIPYTHHGNIVEMKKQKIFKGYVAKCPTPLEFTCCVDINTNWFTQSCNSIQREKIKEHNHKTMLLNIICTHKEVTIQCCNGEDNNCKCKVHYHCTTISNDSNDVIIKSNKSVEYNDDLNDEILVNVMIPIINITKLWKFYNNSHDILQLYFNDNYFSIVSRQCNLKSTIIMTIPCSNII